MPDMLDLEETVEHAKVVESAREPSITPPRLMHVPHNLYDTDELKSFVEEEINLSMAERGAFIDNIEGWQTAYEAPSADSPKDFPIANAANLTVPVIKENVNTIFSAIAQTIITPKPTWILKDLAEEWMPFQHIIEQFLDLAGRRELKIDKVMQTLILECVKFGTCVFEIGFEFEEGRQYRYAEDGATVHKKKFIRHKGPKLWPIPLQDFFIRFYEQDIQEAMWCSKRMRQNDKKIKGLIQAGLYELEPAMNVMQQGEEIHVDDALQNMEELYDQVPLGREDHEIHEMWLSWNLNDGDDALTELQTFVSLDPLEILGVRFNPYWHNKRPFGHMVFFPIEHRFYGDGLCSQLEDLQLEISTIHNQRLDNATLANSTMVLVRRASRALKPGDPLFAGKIISVNQPDDVVPFKLGENYPNTITNEQMARNYVERLSGQSEANSRGGMPVTRTTAGAQSMLLQEAAKRLDQTIRGIREGVGFIGEITLALYFQFGADDKPVRWLGEKGRIVDAIFRLPARASELGLGLQAAAPTSQLNKETQQQNSLAMFNLLIQMYERIGQFIIPILQQISPEAIPVFAHSIVSASKQFMFKALEQFDVTNPEDVLSGLSVLERALPAPEDFGGVDSFERSQEELDLLNQLQRLEDILRENPTDGSRGEGVPSVRSELRRFRGEEGIPGGSNSGRGIAPQNAGGSRGPGQGPILVGP